MSSYYESDNFLRFSGEHLNCVPLYKASQNQSTDICYVCDTSYTRGVKSKCGLSLCKSCSKSVHCECSLCNVKPILVSSKVCKICNIPLEVEVEKHKGKERLVFKKHNKCLEDLQAFLDSKKATSSFKSNEPFKNVILQNIRNEPILFRPERFDLPAESSDVKQTEDSEGKLLDVKSYVPSNVNFPIRTEKELDEHYESAKKFLRSGYLDGDLEDFVGDFLSHYDTSKLFDNEKYLSRKGDDDSSSVLEQCKHLGADYNEDDYIEADYNEDDYIEADYNENKYNGKDESREDEFFKTLDEKNSDKKKQPLSLTRGFLRG